MIQRITSLSLCDNTVWGGLESLANAGVKDNYCPPSSTCPWINILCLHQGHHMQIMAGDIIMIFCIKTQNSLKTHQLCKDMVSLPTEYTETLPTSSTHSPKEMSSDTSRKQVWHDALKKCIQRMRVFQKRYFYHGSKKTNKHGSYLFCLRVPVGGVDMFCFIVAPMSTMSSVTQSQRLLVTEVVGT